jgi:hypothetical protein
LEFFISCLETILTHVQERENCYKIQMTRPFFLPSPDVVTFTTSDPVLLPLPSPQLLALHAACAQVAHLSGAREYINKYYEEMKELELEELA